MPCVIPLLVISGELVGSAPRRLVMISGVVHVPGEEHDARARALDELQQPLLLRRELVPALDALEQTVHQPLRLGVYLDGRTDDDDVHVAVVGFALDRRFAVRRGVAFHHLGIVVRRTFVAGVFFPADRQQRPLQPPPLVLAEQLALLRPLVEPRVEQNEPRASVSAPTQVSERVVRVDPRAFPPRRVRGLAEEVQEHTLREGLLLPLRARVVEPEIVVVPRADDLRLARERGATRGARAVSRTRLCARRCRCTRACRSPYRPHR